MGDHSRVGHGCCSYKYCKNPRSGETGPSSKYFWKEKERKKFGEDFRRQSSNLIGLDQGHKDDKVSLANTIIEHKSVPARNVCNLRVSHHPGTRFKALIDSPMHLLAHAPS